MATTEKKAKKKGAQRIRVKSTSKKKDSGFEKAWSFWKTIQIDLSDFKFDREEANAR